MRRPRSRLAILGIAMICVGVNLPFGVIIFVIAGGGGPLFVLGAFFWGGIILNFVGFGVLIYSIVSRWLRRRSGQGDASTGT